MSSKPESVDENHMINSGSNKKNKKKKNKWNNDKIPSDGADTNFVADTAEYTEHQPLVQTDTPSSAKPYGTVVTIPSSGSANGKSPVTKGQALIDESTKKRKRELRALFVASLFCFFFMIVEVVGGYIAHSLAILTDAAHLLTDVAAYCLSIFALTAAEKAKSSSFSFGWHRAEVVGTMASIFTIWALVGSICLEAVKRSFVMQECASKREMATGVECEAVDSWLLMVVGSLGLLVNFGCAGILHLGGTHGHSHHGLNHGHSHGDDHGHSHGEDHGHSHGDDHGHSHGEDHGHSHGEDHGHSHGEDHGHSHGAAKTGINNKTSGYAINAAMLHALGDSVQSLGVVIAGAFMYYTNTYYTPEHHYKNKYSWYNLADPASSFFFAIVTLYMTRTLVKDLLSVLMEGTPAGIDHDDIQHTLESIEHVLSVHDLHVWSIGIDKVALSVHLVSDEHCDVLKEAQTVLEEKFKVTHHTIQVDPQSLGSTNCGSNICQH